MVVSASFAVITACVRLSLVPFVPARQTEPNIFKPGASDPSLWYVHFCAVFRREGICQSGSLPVTCPVIAGSAPTMIGHPAWPIIGRRNRQALPWGRLALLSLMSVRLEYHGEPAFGHFVGLHTDGACFALHAGVSLCWTRDRVDAK